VAGCPAKELNVKKAKHFEGGGGAEDQDERERIRKASNFTDRAAAVQKLAPYSSGRGDDMEEAPAPAPAPVPIYNPRLAPNTSRQRDFRDEDLHPNDKNPNKTNPYIGGVQNWERAAAAVPTKFSPKPGEEEMASVEAMRRPTAEKPKPSKITSSVISSAKPNVGMATQGSAAKTPFKIDYSGMESGSKFAPVQNVGKNTQSSVKPKSPGVGYGKKYTLEEIEATQQATMDAVKGAGSSLGSYLSKLGKRPDDKDKGKRTYRDFSGKMVAYAKGGSVSSASSRGDGIAQRGKTRGRVL
jgi:hypothetical protein